MDKTIKTSRLVLLILIITLFSAVILISMYRVQIIEGEKSLAASKNSIVTESVAAAVRGNVYDRYGREIVSNRTCSNLVINATELFEQEDPNAIILQLAREVVDSGNKYTDTLPITKSPPFEYIRNMTAIQRTMLDGYLDANNLPLTTTAVGLMAFFRDAFDIDSNYSAEEMRIISGIRFEIKIRYINSIHTSSYIFAEDVGIGLLTKLMENNVPGFDERSSFLREIKTDYGAHILGYVGMMNEEETKEYRNEGYSLDALVGKDGVEKAFESRLHGVDGLKRVATTREGTIIETKYLIDPIPGNHVYTTFDWGLQERAETAMSSFITQTNETREADNERLRALGQTDGILQLITGGGIAAIKIDTGEPLAIASYPSYNLSTLMEDYSQLLDDKNKPLFNRALMGAYAPGSTFKPCVALALLDEEVAGLNYTVYDEGKYMKHADYTPECWLYPNGSHGDVNATRAIAVSCNYYFYSLGELLGIDLMSDYAKRFGLGLPTGIELGEELGIMSTQEYKETVINKKWVIGDTIQAAIGQSYTLFTPLQMANYTAAIANNGTRYEASILKSVRSYDYSQSVFERTPKVSGEVAMNQEYYDAVKLGMYQAVNEEHGGTRNAFAGFTVNVAAKTGTAQLGEGITNNAMFICFAPYENPEIALAIAIEHGGAGSSAAAIAREVLEYYFNFKNATASMEHENSLLK